MNRLLFAGFFLCQMIALAACGQNTNSVGCVSQDDCRGTRICVDSVCVDSDKDVLSVDDTGNDTTPEKDIELNDVEPDDAENDAPSDISNKDVDPVICPDICNDGCRNGECHIRSESINSIECPDGLACVVHCEIDGSCGRSVECGDEKCTVLCEGRNSCRGSIDCGDAPQCLVRCLGFNACDTPINCNASECTIECGELGSRDYTCNGGIDCGTNSCQVACLDERSCTAGIPGCEGEDCAGAFTCNEADYCRCMGPGCWPTPD